MKKQVSIIAILIALLVMWFIYSRLGAYTPWKMSLEEKEFAIIGQAFKGIYNSHELERIFTEARDLSDSLRTPLAVVNYGSDSEARDLDQFIGLQMDDTELNVDWESRQFPLQQMVRISIRSHNSVMPQPREVREKAEQFADSIGRVIGTPSIEIYVDSETLDIYFPIR